MELTPLRYFSAIAAAGHMTRAARELGVTQPALSAVVRKLEAEVGAPLLERTSKGVQLTEAGRLFLHSAQQALRAVEEGRESVRELLGLQRGVVRVGGGATAVTYLLPPVIGALRRAHPGLRFFIREAGSAGVAQAVLSGELELGVVTLPLPPGVESDLLVDPLVEDELRLIVPPGHRHAKQVGRARRAATFRWEDLRGEPVVAFAAGAAVRDLIDRAAARAGVTLDVAVEVRSIEAVKAMVGAGIGIGFVSRLALREGEGLACRDDRLSRTLALVRRRARALGPAASEFARALRARKATEK
ncbi:MAG: LysR family transcriptional regulator [Planctomycetota bacterium]|nr:LysR family transcriptional regulator [Planctomycetota bacterium]